MVITLTADLKSVLISNFGMPCRTSTKNGTTFYYRQGTHPFYLMPAKYSSAVITGIAASLKSLPFLVMRMVQLDDKAL